MKLQSSSPLVHGKPVAISGAPLASPVTEEVAREQVATEQGSHLPWAVGGRSKEKLHNPASLDETAKKAVLVLNFVRPYRFYGESVVKACIENGTICIDICGEPQFLELIHAKYHEKAAEKGVYITGSSGFDSIPADLGVLYTRKQMNGLMVTEHENLQESPVQYAAQVMVGGITSVIKLMFAGLFFLFFVKFSIGRHLLIKFPWLFSFGYFSKQGPTQKQMDGSSFTMTFFGQGYSHGFCTEKNKPNIRICTQVKGPEAGYMTTPIAMVQAAMTLLNDTSDLPKGGGVFTPGAAFSRTKLTDKLNQQSIEFGVISSSEV
ncbi:putative saccharopine dehydrogenase-like protein [Cricetulus griseus]|uniref:Saccharopine dehydrogenase-like oxidoreductase n=1 Tax=Cricetulus griseus TaxID=10029 RepID=A0A061ICQ3_CRIGR|nr:putative saccharopine dehydrogenase-like protein [Cricetulus griseus]